MLCQVSLLAYGLQVIKQLLASERLTAAVQQLQAEVVEVEVEEAAEEVEIQRALSTPVSLVQVQRLKRACFSCCFLKAL